MANVILRNIETGVIKVVERVSKEFEKLVAEKTKDGRFPVYEQTGEHDSDPATHAAPEEVAARSKWGLPLHDVTADGHPQSTKGVEAQREKLGPVEVEPVHVHKDTREPAPRGKG